MNPRFGLRAFACLTAMLLLMIAVFGVYAKEQPSPCDAVIALQCEGKTDRQKWLDDVLSQEIDTHAGWYALALAQSGAYDFSAYRAALTSFLAQNTTLPAASREKYALLLLATGDGSDTENTFVLEAVTEAVGTQGIMSRIFGLHLLNNGCQGELDATWAAQELLLLSQPNGGWSLGGQGADVDVTAMALQALAPFYGNDSQTDEIIDQAIQFLSSVQKENGGFASYGIENCESCAQVLIALCALDIHTNDARFVKSGQTVVDALLSYRCEDGSFSHTADGDTSTMATEQAFLALTAAERADRGQGSLFCLDYAAISADETGCGSRYALTWSAGAIVFVFVFGNEILFSVRRKQNTV